MQWNGYANWLGQITNAKIVLDLERRSMDAFAIAMIAKRHASCRVVGERC